MSDFQLDPQLSADCLPLGRIGLCRLLLLNNAQVPWFVLVPEVTVTEFYELERDQQLQILEAINALSTFIKGHFHSDKLNIASIGNKVRQLHIHVIGRDPGDYCWPGVVWGAPGAKAYEQQAVAEIRAALAAGLGGGFSPESLSPKS